MSKNDSKSASTIERPTGGREAAKGWLIMAVLVAVVLAAGYFATH